MQSKATTVPTYLASLPAERRAEIEKVRAVVNRNLDRDGYEEGMSYGMICWVVPHRVFPAGYHCKPEQPLPFAALASQKNYCSVYVPLVVPADVPQQGQDGELHRWFVDAWRKSGKKLDMGKCCIRFQRAEDLALDVLGELIRRVPAKAFVAGYLAAREAQAKKGPKPHAEIRAEAAAREAAKGAKRSEAAPKAAPRAAKKALPERGGRRGK
jgi:hypothetical protein